MEAGYGHCCNTWNTCCDRIPLCSCNGYILTCCCLEEMIPCSLKEVHSIRYQAMTSKKQIMSDSFRCLCSTVWIHLPPTLAQEFGNINIKHSQCSHVFNKCSTPRNIERLSTYTSRSHTRTGFHWECVVRMNEKASCPGLLAMAAVVDRHQRPIRSPLSMGWWLLDETQLEVRRSGAEGGDRGPGDELLSPQMACSVCTHMVCRLTQELEPVLICCSWLFCVCHRADDMTCTLKRRWAL